jgi:hypothetical protein
LNNYGNTSVERIKQNLASTGTNATGRTSQSLRYTVTDTGDKITLQIIGKPYLAVVETGRRPTPEYTKPSYDFVNSIKQWIAAKGGDQSSAYDIAKNIHQKGTKLYQDGGRKDIISNVINQDLTAKISQDVLKAFGNLLVTNIKSIYGSNRN